MQKELLFENEEYKYNFQFSILEIFSKTTKDPIEAEKKWKIKMGSRAFGLTLN